MCLRYLSAFGKRWSEKQVREERRRGGRRQGTGTCELAASFTRFMPLSNCLVSDHLLFVVYLSLELGLYLVTMRGVPPPVHNGFQSYVRFILGSDSAALSQHRRLCSSCLRVHRQTSKGAQVTAHSSRARSRHRSIPSVSSQPWQPQSRAFATVVDREDYGPMKEYNDRIHSRKLREDEHQRS